MEQKALAELLEQYPTPLYVFEERLLKERVRYLRSWLPENVSLCFAVKANPFLGGFLTDCVERFEICSPGEMYLCEKQGIPAERFVLSGVNKDEASMRYAFEHGLCGGILTVESVHQFELIRALSSEYRQRVRLMPRLTGGSQFGMEGQEILDLLKEYRDAFQVAGLPDGKEQSSQAAGQPDGEKQPSQAAGQPDEEKLLVLAGIQFFSGTQKTSLKKHRKELALLDDFVDEVFVQTGVRVPELEYGPGFPAMYFSGENFDEDAYMREFFGLLRGMRFRAPVTLELGRGIAASCGSLITRVADVKCNHGENYAILDSGIHHLTYFGQFMAMKHPLFDLWPAREASQDDPVWNLCGSLCTTNDLLVKKLPVHDLKIGDVLTFRNAGAYCMTEGISLFLSRDLPAVVWRKENGESMLLRDAHPVWPLNGGMDL